MEFEKLIMARRSARGYESAIDEAALKEAVSRARFAPSWKNSQESRVYAAVTPETTQQVFDALPDFNKNSSANAALLVTTFVKGIAGFTAAGQPTGSAGDCWGAYDLGLHDAYLILALQDLGYDSLIMGLSNEKALREIFAIPENEQIMSVIAVGKRSKPANTPVRKPLEETLVTK
ncbi:MAG: nitroreductase family protein [Clostridiales bacterium]|nr:nitroreductase family protein [Clostridiales bacterium]